MEMALTILVSVISGLTLAGLTGVMKMLRGFIKEQRAANERNDEFRHSMQRAEIARTFRFVVEEGKPVTREELEHLEATYRAYSGDGQNGVGTLMYERIKENAIIVTKVDVSNDIKIGGTE